MSQPVPVALDVLFLSHNLMTQNLYLWLCTCAKCPAAAAGHARWIPESRRS